MKAQRSRFRLRRGNALAYTILALPVMFGIGSLALDGGRVYVVKNELQRAADAASRYAIMGLPYGVTTTENYAIDAANDNSADGSAVNLSTATDIEFGLWNSATRTFTVLTGSARSTATAIRITARRTAATGNAVSLVLGKAIGRSQCDVTASAIATVKPPKYGIVGLDYINMTGNASDSYWSSTGVPSSGYWGTIASNGNISLTGSTSIQGDARPGVGGSVSGGGHVSGVTTPLTYPMIYPVADPGTYRTQNDNNQVPSGIVSSSSFSLGKNKSATLPGGNYYFNNFSMGAGSSLTFTGAATLWIYGDVSISGSTTTSSNIPGNLKINMVTTPTGGAPGSVNVTSSAALYADIYAPLSAVTLSGSGDIYGSVIAKSIDMTGTSSIHFDLSLDSNGGAITLVK